MAPGESLALPKKAFSASDRGNCKVGPKLLRQESSPLFWEKRIHLKAKESSWSKTFNLKPFSQVSLVTDVQDI